MYAVTVTISLRPGTKADFMPLMAENAAASLSLEPDCHRFDICLDPSQPDEVFLYELYTNRSAFDHHLGMPHFLTFDAKVAQMIAQKHVRTFSEVLS